MNQDDLSLNQNEAKNVKVAYIRLKKLKGTPTDEGFSEAVSPEDPSAEQLLGVIVDDYINTYHIVVADEAFFNQKDANHRKQYTLQLISCTNKEASFKKVIGMQKLYPIKLNQSCVISIPEREEEIEITLLEIMDLGQWRDRIRG